MPHWLSVNKYPRARGWYVVELWTGDGDGNIDAWYQTMFWSGRVWEKDVTLMGHWWSLRFEYEVDPATLDLPPTPPRF